MAFEPGTAILLVGQMVQIRVAAGPDGTRPVLGPMTWASTNPVVASVSGGLVRALAPGSATITMSGPDGPARSGPSRWSDALGFGILGRGVGRPT